MVAQLYPINLVTPGFLGVNLSQSNAILPPQYATKAENAVIDPAGRLASRKGYTNQITTDITGTPDIKTLFEYIQEDGSTETIVAWDGGIGNDIADPEANDISGSVTDADGRWFFQNFNDKVVGFQAGQKLIVYNGTGNFATVSESAGTAPTGGIGAAVYGRIWQTDSTNQVINYTTLLDETTWSGTGAGSIDMSNVWVDGTDEITGIVGFNGFFVVFGKRHIVVWEDGTGNQLGVDPDNLQVVDVITGTGCVSQHTIVPVTDTDLLYLSQRGVRYLSRVIQEKSAPDRGLTKLVDETLTLATSDESDQSLISAEYSPVEGFYLVSLPDSGVTWVIDLRNRYADDRGDLLGIVTTWTFACASILYKQNGDLLLAKDSEINLYGTVSGDNGETFRFVYQSPWLELGPELASRVKILKRIRPLVFVSNKVQLILKWYWDFKNTFAFRYINLGGELPSEWNESEWNEAEWGAGQAFKRPTVPAAGTGQYIRVQLEGDINQQFSMQEIALYTKLGRFA